MMIHCILQDLLNARQNDPIARLMSRNHLQISPSMDRYSNTYTLSQCVVGIVRIIRVIRGLVVRWVHPTQHPERIVRVCQRGRTAPDRSFGLHRSQRLGALVFTPIHSLALVLSGSKSVNIANIITTPCHLQAAHHAVFRDDSFIH